MKKRVILWTLILSLLLNIVPFTAAATTGTITIKLYDDDGDGWNGNELQLYLNNDYSQSFTVSGRSRTYTLEYDSENYYEFKWKLGQYASECSITISLDGTTIFSASEADCGAYADGELLFTYGTEPVILGSGTCGTGLTWTVYDNGALIISGSGAMSTYSNSSPYVAPWQQKYNSKITKIIIKDGVTSIGGNAFYQCSYAEKVVIPNSVTSIGINAFRECDALKEITIPDSVTSLGNASFYGCDHLTSATLPKGITSLNTYVFYGCSSLKSITVPANITSIGTYTFYNCTNLESVRIEGNVTSIGSSAFRSCTALKEILFLGSAPSFGNAVFTGVTADAYYDGNNTTWTSSVTQNYGGTITWHGGPVATGSGTQSSPYVIYTEADLRRLSQYIATGQASAGKYYRLGNSITLTETWIPIGTAENPFRGRFDGNQYTISGMTRDGDYSALFAYLGGGATVKNLTISNPAISGDEYVAGIAAYADASAGNITVQNCHLTGGSINGNDGNDFGKYASAVIAYVPKNENGYSVSISNCTNRTSLSGDDYMGGMVGYGSGVNITDCKNYNGAASGSNTTAVGGIIGAAYSCNITRCANYGSISGNAYSEDNGSSELGGIAGNASSTNFTSCVNYGGVSAFFVGGICGGYYISGCTFTNCLNIGTMTHSSDGSGYAIGYTGSNTFKDCYYYSGCFTYSGRGHNETTATPVSLVQLKSGEVTYLLQSTRTSQTWGQKIATDGTGDQYPQLSGDVVYRTYNCMNAPVGYANESVTGIHNWLAASCENPVTCSYCGQTTGEALGHTPAEAVVENEKPATCLTEGSYDEVIYCSVETCLAELSRETVTLPVTPHTPGEAVRENEIAPSCTAEGSYDEVIYCSTDGCGYMISSTPMVIEKLDHHYDQGVCSVCGALDPEIYIAGGICGDDLIWRLDVDGVLHIIGTGAMYDFDFTDDYQMGKTPWLSYSGQIKALEMDSRVTHIGDNAFAGCTSLSDVSFHEGLTSIGHYAFKNTMIKEAILPEGLTVLGDGAFCQCSHLQKLYLPGSVEELGQECFKDCIWLTEVTHDQGVTKIVEQMFQGCSTLTSITIPSSVTVIGDYAFRYCSALEEVIFLGNAPEMYSNSFGSVGSFQNPIPAYYPCGNETWNSDVLEGSYGGYFTWQVRHDVYETKSVGATCTEYGYTYEVCTRCDDKRNFVDTENALGHDFTQWETIVPAECTEAGEQSRRCDRCGEVETKTINALGHSFTNYISNEDATCTEDGTKTAKCDRCKVTDTVGDADTALGHSFINYISNEDATCTKDGTKTAKCDRCDETDTAVDSGSMKAHSYGNWIEVIPAGCTASGMERRYCANCEAFETNTLAATGHAYEAIVTAPKCESAGFTTYICASCEDRYIDDETDALGHSFTNYVSDNNATCVENTTETAKCDRCDATDTRQIPDTALGHCWDEWIVMEEATCLHDGEQRRDCTVCDEYEYAVITNGPHAYGEWTVTQEPSCTKGGIETQTCTLCGYEKTNALKPTGHRMGEWVVEKPASCTAEGVEISCCENCDHKVSQSISAIGHHFLSEITAPDCINGGFTTYTCINCGDCYTDNATDPVGHDYDSEVTKEDCENNGYTTYTCKECGYRYVGDEVKALGHSYQSEVTAADCENGGYTTHTCTRCDASYMDSETKALGHKWDKGFVTVEPGEYTSGTKEYTCERCGDTMTEILGALGHTHVYTSVVTPATCTTDGFTTFTCVCGNSYKDEYVTAPGHKYGTWYTYTAATCTKVGEKRSDCSNCDAYQSDTIAVIEHSFSKYFSDGNATCTKDGTKTATCDNCTLTDIVTDLGTKLGHSWGDWEETKAATSVSEGEEMRSCDRCGDSEFRSIPKLTHPFVDVPAGKFYEIPVIWAVNNEITNGVDATHFAPDNICNRGQVVTFLWRAAGSPEPTSDFNPFNDVKEGKFYYKAVLWAVEEGITNGTSATTFSPDDNCTRGQVATFLWRTLNEPSASSSTNPFKDVAQGKFYYDAVLWAVEAEVTNGMTKDTFAPNNACTRGQIVTFLYRALG